MSEPRKRRDDSSTSRRAAARAVPTARGERQRDQPARERTVQSSISLRPSQWKRLDILGDLTRWGRSGAVSQAVDLLTSLPVPVTQRLATLSRTTVGITLQERLRAAIEEAVAAAEAELPDSPWAEFDAALMTAGEEFHQSGAAELSEVELIAAAEQAKQEYRRDRRSRTGRKTSQR